KEEPLFGIGEGAYADYSDGHFVAHNSFLHCFAELGFFGGTAYLGAFYFAIWTLHRLGSPPIHIFHPELKRLRPFMMTLVGGYAAGLLSLSRIMVVPTYMVLALATAYLRLVVSVPPLPDTRFDRRLVRRLVLVSIAFVMATYLYVKSNV